MNEYDGHWITTYTGKKFHYLAPKEDEVDIVDIAHALSLTCRFGGHCKEFYSVAEHSILVAEQVRPELRLSALLHDAHEAYLHDVPRPIKQDIAGYKEIADRIQTVIQGKFGISSSLEIEQADNVLLATEAQEIMPNMTDWAELPTPLESGVYLWASDDAEESFLTYFAMWSKR